MTRTFEWFVAARYLLARRRQAVIPLVTAVSVAGVAAGVMALVIALAINSGFRKALEESLLGATPHVVLLEKTPSTGIENWRDITARAARIDGVKEASPALYAKVLASGPMQSAEATLKGMRMDSPELRAHIREGSLDQIENLRGLPGIVLGSQLAQRIGMRAGDVVRILSPQGEMTPFGMRPVEFRFRVAAIFESGFFDLDNQLALTTIAQAQRVLALPDVVNAIELKLDDPGRAPEVAQAAEAIAGPELGASHWMEQNRQLLNALRMEKIVSVITISLIQLVAALNILTALFLRVMEKKRDIAVLLSMGARRAQIARIFLWQGLMLAGGGVALGLALGYSLSGLAGRNRWIRIDEEIYSLSYVPFDPRWADALWIAALAFAVALLAAWYPARAAASVAPAETLRYE
ncbi:MAG: ABC transporter permease [Bryobacteraceae bacterium]|nr:MAG: ABC transporter permease [Bryobacteraceae bacterium]